MRQVYGPEPGRVYWLHDDRGERNFDLALSLYGPPGDATFDAADYAFSGGINKFQAARQFIDAARLQRYQGFIFLDDDLEMSQSQLSRFFDYCAVRGFDLAQPSLTLDSAYSHTHLLNASSYAAKAATYPADPGPNAGPLG